MSRYDKKRVLVTGGAGFIGSELVRQLIASDHSVTVIDNMVNGRLENLEGLDPARMQLVEADIRDLRIVAPLLAGVDVVYHLACLGVRHSIHSPEENHEVNASATLGLLRAARRAEIGRFVHVSSSEVYGTAIHAPISEQHPTFPMTVYGAAKLAGEGYARAYYRTYEFPTVVVRPFNTYGPRSHHEGDSGEVIPKFMLRAMAGKPLIVFGDGLQTRDFLHVADTARGIILCGEAEAALGETINLGSGGEITIRELAETIGHVVGRETQIAYELQRPGDTLRLLSDNSLAERVLGFGARTSFEEGLAGLLEWYRAKGESPEALLENETVRNWAV